MVGKSRFIKVKRRISFHGADLTRGAFFDAEAVEGLVKNFTS